MTYRVRAHRQSQASAWTVFLNAPYELETHRTALYSRKRTSRAQLTAARGAVISSDSTQWPRRRSHRRILRMPRSKGSNALALGSEQRVAPVATFNCWPPPPRISKALSFICVLRRSMRPVLRQTTERPGKGRSWSVYMVRALPWCPRIFCYTAVHYTIRLYGRSVLLECLLIY